VEGTPGRKNKKDKRGEREREETKRKMHKTPSA
jgi:hypothetical protein